MPKRRYALEEIVAKLRQVDAGSGEDGRPRTVQSDLGGNIIAKPVLGGPPSHLRPGCMMTQMEILPYG
jgi:hypothetical protein